MKILLSPKKIHLSLPFQQYASVTSSSLSISKNTNKRLQFLLLTASYSTSSKSDKQAAVKEKVDSMWIILGKDGNHYNKQINEWETLWQDNITPWDLGQATPLLSDELEKGLLSNHLSSVQKYRVLVPGCGTGYDLYTIAKHVSSCIIRQLICSCRIRYPCPARTVVTAVLAQLPL